MFELPNKQGTYHLPQEAFERLQRDYQNINVLHELKKMRNWLEVNPRRRKRDTFRFIVNWLNNAKPSAVGSVPEAASNHYAIVAERNNKTNSHVETEEDMKRKWALDEHKKGRKVPVSYQHYLNGGG